MSSPTAELIPAAAVSMLYRRYLKASLKIPNTTIRHLLMQQIRSGFRRHQNLKSGLAQRELVAQAHQDLMILEDERHARTLFINKHGAVSCLEWEMRRNEYSISSRGLFGYQFFFTCAFAFFFHIYLHLQTVDEAEPEICKTVDFMAARMEVDDPKDLPALRQEQTLRSIDDMKRQRELEARILATFRDAPSFDATPLPSLKNPTPARRLAGVPQ